jgi:hypothetical protein
MFPLFWEGGASYLNADRRRPALLDGGRAHVVLPLLRAHQLAVLQVIDRQGPLGDLSLRAALMAAIDRQALAAVESTFVPNPGRLLMGGALGFDPGLRVDLGAPAASEQVLSQSFVVGYHPATAWMVPVLMQSLGQAGLQPEALELGDADIDGVLRDGGVDVALLAMVLDQRGDEVYSLAEIVADVGGTPEAHALAAQLWTTSERGERKALYRALERELLADGTLVPLGEVRGGWGVFVLSERVQGFADPTTQLQRWAPGGWFSEMVLAAPPRG